MGKQNSDNQCAVDGCERSIFRRGNCYAHWYRVKKYGDPFAGKAVRGDVRAFADSAISSETDECIIWPFGKKGVGYGFMWDGGTNVGVNRYVCEAVHGPPPSDKHQAAHDPVRCNNPSCVNPRHLRWASPQENAEDAVVAGTRPVGEKRWNARLTEDGVKAILSDTRRSKEIANEYGVSATTVRNIKTGRTWAYLLRPLADKLNGEVVER